MLPQAEAETSLDPNAASDHVAGEPTAFGIHQWHRPRLAGIKAATGTDIATIVGASKGDLQSRVKASWRELNHPPLVGMKAIGRGHRLRRGDAGSLAVRARGRPREDAVRRGQMADRWAALRLHAAIGLALLEKLQRCSSSGPSGHVPQRGRRVLAALSVTSALADGANSTCVIRPKTEAAIASASIPADRRIPMSLPPLKWVASPNYNERHGVRVDQIIIHDMEGSYAGSIAYFGLARSQVSAHYCVRGDGGEVTQMVHISDRAWHACAANSRSVGIEMEGYAKNGYKPELLLVTARITAFLCHYLQIPVRHARGGVGPGIESHWGLGPSGGGHRDPSTDMQWMETFVAAVQAEYDKGDFPALWEPDSSAAPCRLNPPVDKPAVAGPDLSTFAGVQQALNALGNKLEINGVADWNTTQAIKGFQIHVGLVADGVAGPLTRAAIQKELSGR